MILKLYFSDNIVCEDVDECFDGSSGRPIHDCDHNCTNTIGTFECSCVTGYRLEHRTICNNIDECFEKTHSCADWSICTDNQGSYECRCRPGWEGDPYWAGDVTDSPKPGCQVRRVFIIIPLTSSTRARWHRFRCIGISYIYRIENLKKEFLQMLNAPMAKNFDRMISNDFSILDLISNIFSITGQRTVKKA